MLPVTADNIFWAAEVSSSFAVRAVLGGIVRWRVFVSDCPSPSADSILSWSWPCVCTVAISFNGRRRPALVAPPRSVARRAVLLCLQLGDDEI